jgi:hypothetical protein
VIAIGSLALGMSHADAPADLRFLKLIVLYEAGATREPMRAVRIQITVSC